MIIKNAKKKIMNIKSDTNKGRIFYKSLISFSANEGENLLEKKKKRI